MLCIGRTQTQRWRPPGLMSPCRASVAPSAVTGHLWPPTLQRRQLSLRGAGADAGGGPPESLVSRPKARCSPSGEAAPPTFRQPGPPSQASADAAQPAAARARRLRCSACARRSGYGATCRGRRPRSKPPSAETQAASTDRRASHSAAVISSRRAPTTWQRSCAVRPPGASPRSCSRARCGGPKSPLSAPGAPSWARCAALPPRAPRRRPPSAGSDATRWAGSARTRSARRGPTARPAACSTCLGRRALQESPARRLSPTRRRPATTARRGHRSTAARALRRWRPVVCSGISPLPPMPPHALRTTPARRTRSPQTSRAAPRSPPRARSPCPRGSGASPAQKRRNLAGPPARAAAPAPSARARHSPGSTRSRRRSAARSCRAAAGCRVTS
mmetsp:Transcript_32611/g.83835  ORF Transcript_32611/g.83835 Transcript_32611/m.83835 type:complete len:389 (+) Transcript_32611:15-1181(+)